MIIRDAEIGIALVDHTWFTLFANVFSNATKIELITEKDLVKVVQSHPKYSVDISHIWLNSYEENNVLINPIDIANYFDLMAINHSGEISLFCSESARVIRQVVEDDDVIDDS